MVFSDGTPMTSADIAFSVEQNQAEEVVGNALNPVLDRIQTPDPRRVVFTTTVPFAAVPAALTIYSNAVVSKDRGGKSVEEFGEAPIGTGPFVVDQWTRGTELHLIKNNRYWDAGKPKLDSVTFTVAPNGNTRSTQLAVVRSRSTNSRRTPRSRRCRVSPESPLRRSPRPRSATSGSTRFGRRSTTSTCAARSHRRSSRPCSSETARLQPPP